MELFSEVLGCYYQIVADILKKAQKNPLSRAEITKIIDEDGFMESSLTLLPRLLSGEWPLLEHTKEGYCSKVEYTPDIPLTYLQSSFIRAILEDERICLFFEEEQISELKKALMDIKPLFRTEDFINADQVTEKDPFTDTAYQKHFREIICAIQENRYVSLTIKPDGTSLICKTPYKLLYSPKEDQFKLCLLAEEDNKMEFILLSAISQITVSEKRSCEKPSLHNRIFENHSNPPIQFEIYPRRNAVERCMLQFSNYEKLTEYDEVRDCYLCSIWYDKMEEEELFAQLLSFGPLVFLKKPKHLVKRMKELVVLQYELFTKPIS